MENEKTQSLVANEATNRAPVLTVPVYFTKILDLADSGTDIRLRLLVEDDTISSNFLFTIAGDFGHLFKIVRDTDNPATDANTTAFKLVIQEDAVIDFGDQSSFHLDISVSDGDSETDPYAHSSEVLQLEIAKNNPPSIVRIGYSGTAEENISYEVRTNANFGLIEPDADDRQAGHGFEVYEDGRISSLFDVKYDDALGRYFIWKKPLVFVDYEVQARHNLQVQAIDQFGATSNVLEFVIQVQDIDEEIIFEELAVILNRGMKTVILDESHLKATHPTQEIRYFIFKLPDESVTLLFDGLPVTTSFEFSPSDIENGRLSIEISDQAALVDTFISMRAWQGGSGFSLPIVTRTLDDSPTSEGSDIVDVSQESAHLTISTGDGADIITTGTGDDYVVGGTGNDRLIGGAGDDIFQYYHYQTGHQTIFLEENGYRNAKGHPLAIAAERRLPTERHIDEAIILPDGTPSSYSSFLYSGQMTITDFGVGNDMIYFSNIRLFNQLASDDSPHDDEAVPASLFYEKYRLDDKGDEIAVHDDSGHDLVKIFARFQFEDHEKASLFQSNNSAEETWLVATLENYTGELNLDEHIVTIANFADI